MLVYFSKVLVLEGENSRVSRKHFWSKPEIKRYRCYSYPVISGICDESELDSEVERLSKEALLNEKGYGEEFFGWNRVVPFEELPALYGRLGYAREDRKFPNLKVEYVNTWPMEKILKKLTGKQFIQFCREQGIALKEGEPHV